MWIAAPQGKTVGDAVIAMLRFNGVCEIWQTVREKLQFYGSNVVDPTQSKVDYSQS